MIVSPLSFVLESGPLTGTFPPALLNETYNPTQPPKESTTVVDNEEEALAAEILGLETSPECQEALLSASITDVVARLFRVSKLVVKSTTRDRHAKAETAHDDRLDDSFDILHVREKYGGRGAEAWLVQRLGKAITKRRQYFLYCRKHRERLAQPSLHIAPSVETHELQPAFDRKPELPRLATIQSTSQVATSKPSKIQTTASTLGPVDLDVVDDGFDDARSFSTAITSLCDDGGEHTLRLPKLIDVGTIGEEFECPYCYTVQKFNGERGWR